ncbi:MAG: hypothetical protein JW894_16330 [Bacteroidales bacterium]|nr:hypothetical protein [Bacteroidales bacterium]
MLKRNCLFLRNCISIPFTLVMIIACNTDEVCDENTITNVVASFYTTVDNRVVDTTAMVTSIIAVNDSMSILYESEDAVQSVSFPLNNSLDSCAVIMDFTLYDTIPKPDTLYFTDTLTFFYNIELIMESIECGFVHYFHLQSINWTDNFIEDVEIVNPAVTTREYENIKILY